jgi:hypothetical protein
VLFAEFLRDVEIQKKVPASEQKQKTESKKEVKVYDFAGESVTVNAVGSISDNSISSGSSKKLLEDGRVSPASSLGSSSTSTSSSLVSNNIIDVADSPLGHRSQGTKRRGGISFLSGDPSKIGLAGANGKKGGGGIQAVLNALKAKKQKMGTLEKSRLDWQSFKKTEGIEEELQTQVKSKDG